MLLPWPLNLSHMGSCTSVAILLLSSLGQGLSHNNPSITVHIEAVTFMIKDKNTPRGIEGKPKREKKQSRKVKKRPNAFKIIHEYGHLVCDTFMTVFRKVFRKDKLH